MKVIKADFMKGLLDAQAVTSNDLPNGLSEDDIALISRILKAKHTDELKDVPTERIVDVYQKLPALIDLLSEETLLKNDKTMAFLKKNAVKAKNKKRRVL